MEEYELDSQCRNESCKYHNMNLRVTSCNRYLLSQLEHNNRCPDYAPALTFEDFSDSSSPDMSTDIREACNEMAEFLISKNKSYGNSIADPIKIFSKTDTLEQINVRLDDKLSRIIRGNCYPGDNDLKDISGYYILKRAVEINEEK